MDAKLGIAARSDRLRRFPRGRRGVRGDLRSTLYGVEGGKVRTSTEYTGTGTITPYLTRAVHATPNRIYHMSASKETKTPAHASLIMKRKRRTESTTPHKSGNSHSKSIYFHIHMPALGTIKFLVSSFVHHHKMPSSILALQCPSVNQCAVPASPS